MATKKNTVNEYQLLNIILHFFPEVKNSWKEFAKHKL